MAKTKSYAQMKADLARLAEKEAALKKQIAEQEKKQKEVATVTIGKAFLECFPDEDLLAKSSDELRQFVKDVCTNKVENRKETKTKAETEKVKPAEVVSGESKDKIVTDSVKDKPQEKPAKSYNPASGWGA